MCSSTASISKSTPSSNTAASFGNIRLTRERLLRHWRDPRHPHSERFAEREADICRLLESPRGSDAQIDAELRQRGLSLRVMVKEIPSVFGSFY